ncbi:hypothetical protein E2C01_022988 [Portunus trituberculatus]|uniref:Uncharacterized protein n=1 Tax=Portunus trituberculatus TaxID=210409 RepID=A0A5B7E6T2_PORTR|nr:hypothetical protein [Portunus trituberculatus]
MSPRRQPYMAKLHLSGRLPSEKDPKFVPWLAGRRESGGSDLLPPPSLPGLHLAASLLSPASRAAFPDDAHPRYAAAAVRCTRGKALRVLSHGLASLVDCECGNGDFIRSRLHVPSPSYRYLFRATVNL